MKISNPLCLLLVILVIVFLASRRLAANALEYFNAASGELSSLHTNIGICSKRCCSNDWPGSIGRFSDKRVKESEVGKSIFTSNITCRDNQVGTGCTCLTSRAKNVLSNRGIFKA